MASRLPVIFKPDNRGNFQNQRTRELQDTNGQGLLLPPSTAHILYQTFQAFDCTQEKLLTKP